MNLIREPDAGNPPVRFDERRVETEHGVDTQAPATERAGNRYAPLTHRATLRLYRVAAAFLPASLSRSNMLSVNILSRIGETP